MSFLLFSYFIRLLYNGKCILTLLPFRKSVYKSLAYVCLATDVRRALKGASILNIFNYKFTARRLGVKWVRFVYSSIIESGFVVSFQSNIVTIESISFLIIYYEVSAMFSNTSLANVY